MPDQPHYRELQIEQWQLTCRNEELQLRSEIEKTADRFELARCPVAGDCADQSTSQAAGRCTSKFNRGWTSQRKNFKRSERGECTDSPLSNVQRPNHLGFHCKTCMLRYRVTDE